MTVTTALLPGRELNRPALRAKLAHQGVVQIAAFAEPGWAAAVREGLRNRPRGDWTVAVRADGPVEYHRDLPRHRELIGDATRRARAALVDGGFAYRFRRTFDDHGDACACLDCEVRAALGAPPVIELLNDLGVPVTRPGEIFASGYGRGDFLGPHDDAGNGEIGFVLNLSRDWRPQQGGLLLFLDRDRSRVRMACVPTFNTLCLFRLPRDRGLPHMVTEVVAGVRHAVTGWFR